MTPWVKEQKVKWQQENPADDYRYAPGEFICLNREHGYACKSYDEHVRYRVIEVPQHAA